MFRPCSQNDIYGFQFQNHGEWIKSRVPCLASEGCCPLKLQMTIEWTSEMAETWFYGVLNETRSEEGAKEIIEDTLFLSFDTLWTDAVSRLSNNMSLS